MTNKALIDNWHGCLLAHRHGNSGGLLLSTLLTLVVVPVVYSFIDDAMEWLKRRGRRRKALGSRVVLGK